jgi:hypothetical protein
VQLMLSAYHECFCDTHSLLRSRLILFSFVQKLLLLPGSDCHDLLPQSRLVCTEDSISSYCQAGLHAQFGRLGAYITGFKHQTSQKHRKEGITLTQQCFECQPIPEDLRLPRFSLEARARPDPQHTSPMYKMALRHLMLQELHNCYLVDFLTAATNNSGT